MQHFPKTLIFILLLVAMIVYLLRKCTCSGCFLKMMTIFFQITFYFVLIGVFSLPVGLIFRLNNYPIREHRAGLCSLDLNRGSLPK